MTDWLYLSQHAATDGLRSLALSMLQRDKEPEVDRSGLQAKIKEVRAKTKYKLPDYDPKACAELEAEKEAERLKDEQETGVLQDAQKKFNEYDHNIDDGIPF